MFKKTDRQAGDPAARQETCSGENKPATDNATYCATQASDDCLDDSFDLVADTDPRLIFLHRAAARLTLVYSADMTLEEAIGGLVEPFEELIGRQMLCAGEREIAERLDRAAVPPKWRRAA
jgi:hypothetical protein